MSPIITVLRLIHILCGVYWAGTVFFFVTFLEPTIRSLGPDGGKVMLRLFERGYMKLLPMIAVVTVLSGLWLLWIQSSGFDATYMRSSIGMSLSTGGGLAILALIIGITVMRPAGERVFAMAKQLPELRDESQRKTLMAEMESVRARLGMAGRIVFMLLVGAVALMAVARYI
jgi:hypothetical protein